MSKNEDDDTQAIVHTDGQYSAALAVNPEFDEASVELAFRDGKGNPTTFIAYITLDSAEVLVQRLQYLLDYVERLQYLQDYVGSFEREDD